MKSFQLLFLLLMVFLVSRNSHSAEPTKGSIPAQEVIGNDANVVHTGTEGFVYDPTGRRDPFEPESEIPKTDLNPSPSQQAESQTPRRALEPLEYFDLSQLKVTAIIWNTKNPRAMVRDPNGTMHSVKIKSRIGQRNGFVTAIREGEIVVVEYTQQQGQWAKTFNVLYLR